MKKKYNCLLLLSLLLLALFAFLHSNLSLTLTRYTLPSAKSSGSFRVVFLSDLHGREFGAGNRRLLKKIADEQPDIIAFVGDMIDEKADEAQVERVCALISAAVRIAPVYLCMGNHEYTYMGKTGASLAERLSQAGAEVLDAGYKDIELNGTPVRIGGYEGYYRTPHMDSADPEVQSASWRFFKEFEDTDRFKLLLDHIPTNWLDWEYRENTPVDLVLSGHYHGGVVRIPILGQGLYAPYVGWFPKYTKGCFEGAEATCILTTGLAGAHGFPRLFNPPEIVTVDVVPA